MWSYISYDELYHHGIKGQKWGVRRYQNEDGTLTEAGEKRYNNGRAKLKSLNDEFDRTSRDPQNDAARALKNTSFIQKYDKIFNKTKYNNDIKEADNNYSEAYRNLSKANKGFLNFKERKTAKENYNNAKDAYWKLLDKNERLRQDLTLKEINKLQTRKQRQAAAYWVNSVAPYVSYSQMVKDSGGEKAFWNQYK